MDFPSQEQATNTICRGCDRSIQKPCPGCYKINDCLDLHAKPACPLVAIYDPVAEPPKTLVITIHKHCFYREMVLQDNKLLRKTNEKFNSHLC